MRKASKVASPAISDYRKANIRIPNSIFKLATYIWSNKNVLYQYYSSSPQWNSQKCLTNNNYQYLLYSVCAKLYTHTDAQLSTDGNSPFSNEATLHLLALMSADRQIIRQTAALWLFIKFCLMSWGSFRQRVEISALYYRRDPLVGVFFIETIHIKYN